MRHGPEKGDKGSEWNFSHSRENCGICSQQDVLMATNSGVLEKQSDRFIEDMTLLATMTIFSHYCWGKEASDYQSTGNPKWGELLLSSGLGYGLCRSI